MFQVITLIPIIGQPNYIRPTPLHVHFIIRILSRLLNAAMHHVICIISAVSESLLCNGKSPAE